ncbi:MAG: CARDB domain-containing protein [Pyrinomonadaceae bacterium]
MNRIFSILVLVSALAISAYSLPPAPDVTASLTGPATASPYTTNAYSVSVRNQGNGKAFNVSVSITLPVTNTSPTKHILGTVSGMSNGCQISGLKIVCQIGTLKPNKSGSKSFNLELPVSAQPWTITADASTTSNEYNTGNNSANITPNPVYVDHQVSSGNALVTHCTGTNLISYFECMLYPSSISSHQVSLQQGGTLNFSYPGYGGTWNQPSDSELVMQYTENGTPVMNFQGYGSNSNCFEGIATFPQNTQYMSVYKVCL